MTTAAPLRCLLWLAVSTPQQAEDEHFSLPKQEADARAVCEAHGWQIVDVLKIPGHSRRYHTIAEANAAMSAAGIDALDRFLQHVKRRDFDVLICRDGDRLGRTQSMMAEVAGRTYDDAGARIYTLANNAMVERGEHLMWTAFSGYQAANDIRRLVEYQREGVKKRIARGLPNNRPPMSHIVIRDEYGNPLKMVANPKARLMILDMVSLVLEGVGFTRLERELEARFGHMHPETGKPIGMTNLYDLLYNPVFWGHNVYGRLAHNKSRPHELYLIDPDVPPPPGVKMHYNTHEAALPEALGRLVLAELHRRKATARGQSRPYRTSPFAGLLICGKCGRPLAYQKAKDFHGGEHYKYFYYGCRSHRVGSGCDNVKTINVKSLQRQIEPYLRRWLAVARLEDAFPASGDSGELQRDLIEKALASEREAARTLIQQQSRNPAMVELYQEEIDAAAKRIADLEVRRVHLARSAVTVSEQQRTERDGLARLPDVSDLWKLPDTEINQRLFRLLGRWRFETLGREIVGLVVL